MILSDLPQEALVRRRELKPVTSLLMETQIGYMWSPVSALVVHHQGAMETTTGLESRFTLLRKLGLCPPQDETPKTETGPPDDTPSLEQDHNQECYMNID